ncbi:uncharacterized protein At5g39865-like [Rutidosis leptorrhynchoides]|uniref:uncharacterized protein At5g39865-like n=1 Tax=Rutidosis leptorrhynchoides TaxID=125765 RepID=UPI003A996BE3
MGCAGSKQKRCRHCNSAYSPVPRSYSMHVHHPAQAKSDSYHVVALTSSTLGSMKLDSSNPSNIHISIDSDNNNHNYNHLHGKDDMEEEEDSKKKKFSVGLIEAKTWSNMIEEKISKIVPKTPTMTPPGEPENINTWEMMEGLEDISPLNRSPIRVRSFSFDVVRDYPILADNVVSLDRPKSRFQEESNNNNQPAQPMWLQQVEADGDPRVKSIEFDPEIIAMFGKSLEDLPSETQFQFGALDGGEQPPSKADNEPMKVKCGKEDNKVVVYFTSLRGVRKTYEDCCHVRVILKSLGVQVDERDVSMHSGFKEELKKLLGDEFKNGGSLPKVFLGKEYIGGAEEIRRMHEEAQLEKLLEPCRTSFHDKCNIAGVCEACGDIRFVPCETCSGSCKVYCEYDEDDDEQQGSEKDYEVGFQRCLECNENGLIRCPICCQ